MNPLPGDQVEELLAKVQLSPRLMKFVQAVLAALQVDHTAGVADLHKVLFPNVALNSANTQLSRLVSTFNEDAEEQRSTLRLNTTANKKAGAAARRVWFTGTYQPPSPLRTPEYDRIPEGQLIDLRGSHLRPVALLVTFNDHETRAILNVFDHPLDQLPRGKLVPVTFLGEHGQWDVYHVRSGQGNQAARTTVERAIQEVKPELVLACGIAFGINPEEQQIGDVLCATAVIGYELGKVRGGGGAIKRTGDAPTVSENLRTRFMSTKIYFDGLRKTDQKPMRVQLGKLLSGEKLIDDQDYRDELVQYYHEDVIGGEMEGIGLHQAASEMNNLKWGVIKAICDWADGKKNTPSKEADQEFAALQAARFTRKMLETFTGDDPGRVLPSLLPPLPRADDLHQLPIEIPDMQAVPASMRKKLNLRKDTDPVRAEATFSVNEHLLAWANAPQSAPIFALLGEYGMGKTIAAQRLALSLNEARQTNPRGRTPMLFDFRDYPGFSQGVPTLDEVLLIGAERSWKARANGEPYTRKMIQELIRGGAVLIFDGLDEALVKMSASDGQTFTRSLLRAFSDHYSEWATHRKNHPSSPDPLHLPKILLTCRTQYFRTLREQQTHFTGQERAENEDDFTAAVLRPLSQQQVLTYLQHALPGQDTERLLDTLRDVHSLEDLTSRPYTLKLVSEFIPQIEQWHLEGREVYGVTLYREMVRRWLERDTGKHHIHPDDKLELAAYMAHHLWTQGEGVLPANQLERWFHGWLASNAALRQRYSGVRADQLEEDLRTSTFLKRQDAPNGETQGFRFSHTSLQEFFLAQFLLQAVLENDPERWNLRVPSEETLDFLGQLLKEHTRSAELLGTLSRWRTGTPAQTRALYFRYVFSAHARGWPHPPLSHADFSDLNLSGVRVKGPLDLRGTSFARSVLRDSRWTGVNLGGVDFSGSDLSNAEFHYVTATEADLQGAKLHHTVFRHCTLTGSHWTPGESDSLQFHGGVDVPSLTGAQYAVAPEDAVGMKLRLSTQSLTLSGNRAFSPDGTRLALGGQSFQVLNVHTGEPLHISVTPPGYWADEVEWSPDGRWIAVAGYGLEIRDATTYEVMCSIASNDFLTGLTWSPDSQYLAAFCDRVQIWEVDTLRVIRDLPIEDRVVRDLEWSPDGRQIAVAGERLSLVVVDTGAVRYLTEKSQLQSVSWSPEGSQLVVADYSSISLFDVESGQLRRLRDDIGSWMVKWSPDGQLLASWESRTLTVIDPFQDEVKAKIVLPSIFLGLAWSPDSQVIATIGEGIQLTLLHEGTVSFSITKPDRGSFASWSDDGQQIALEFESAFRQHSTLEVINFPSGQLAYTQNIERFTREIRWCGQNQLTLTGAKQTNLINIKTRSGSIITGHQPTRHPLSLFSPDRQHYYYLSDRIYILDTQTDEIIFSRENDHSTWLSWSPDSQKIALIKDDTSKNEASFLDMHGDERVFSIPFGGFVRSNAWSPDGTHFAILTAYLTVMNVSTGQVIFQKECLNSTSLCWSPDGLSLALVGRETEIVDAQTGEQLRRSKPGIFSTWVAWSPDGQHLAVASESGFLTLDAETLQPILSIIHMETATLIWDHRKDAPLFAYGEAWRHLRWEKQDARGQRQYVPVLIEGNPLPTPLSPSV